MKTFARCYDRVLPLAPPLNARTHAEAVKAWRRAGTTLTFPGRKTSTTKSPWVAALESRTTPHPSRTEAKRCGW